MKNPSILKAGHDIGETRLNRRELDTEKFDMARSCQQRNQAIRHCEQERFQDGVSVQTEVASLTMSGLGGESLSTKLKTGDEFLSPLLSFSPNRNARRGFG
jgi:hypothetical protein